MVLDFSAIYLAFHRASRTTDELLFFYGTILREYCDKDPTLGYELFKRMSEVMMRRLQRAHNEFLEAMGKSRERDSRWPRAVYIF